MEHKLIACCGLDCAVCDARIATINNDDKLREQIANKWRTEYNVPNISKEMINCTGCSEPGVKLSHCNECQIRTCAFSKGFRTCAECQGLDECNLVKFVHKAAPDALGNLLALR